MTFLKVEHIVIKNVIENSNMTHTHNIYAVEVSVVAN